jgi:hypothetical protein
MNTVKTMQPAMATASSRQEYFDSVYGVLQSRQYFSPRRISNRQSLQLAIEVPQRLEKAKI